MLAHFAPVALAASLLVGCYDVPQPACGFACGPNGECPTSYTCNAADGQCHLNGSSPSLVCWALDAGAGDAAIDVPADPVPPTITAVAPVDGAVDVSPFTAIEVTFSEPVIGTSGSAFRVLVDGTELGGARSYDGPARTLTFTPAEPLPFATQVTIRIEPGITDVAGNPLATTQWSFTTMEDPMPPNVVTHSPSPGEMGVAIDGTVTATFDEPVTGVSSGTFTISRGTTTVAASVTYVPATMTARLTPMYQLAGHTTYTAQLTAGIADLDGHPLAGAPVTWSFTTGPDALAPSVTDTFPHDGEIDVLVVRPIVVNFDEPVTGVDTMSFQVNGGAIAGTVMQFLDDTRWIFDPIDPLPANTTITVTLSSGITDTATPPNALAPVTFSFTTGS